MAAGAAGTMVQAAEPKVVITLKPIHALAAGVMAGLGTPELVVKGRASEHSFALKPSQAKALNQAQLVVWVGEALETFMVKPLAALPKTVRVLELAEIDGIKLLKPREGGVWDGHEAAHGQGKKPAAGHQHDAAIDGHVWLDPDNAKVIVAALARALGDIDGANRTGYDRNAVALSARLDALDAELKQRLAGVRGQPFIVFHDAYHYFEQRYGLTAAGSITVHPESKPSARRLTQIHGRIAELGARCVFSEPQYNPGLVRTVIEGTRANTGVLDPIGADLPEGPDAYFQMMGNLARSLVGCLGASG